MGHKNVNTGTSQRLTPVGGIKINSKVLNPLSSSGQSSSNSQKKKTITP